MLIYEGNLPQKIGAISQLGAKKITLPPKPDRQIDIQTYIHTDRRTDISFYRVALLLKSTKRQATMQSQTMLAKHLYQFTVGHGQD